MNGALLEFHVEECSDLICILQRALVTLREGTVGGRTIMRAGGHLGDLLHASENLWELSRGKKAKNILEKQ